MTTTTLALAPFWSRSWQRLKDIAEAMGYDHGSTRSTEWHGFKPNSSTSKCESHSSKPTTTRQHLNLRRMLHDY